MANSLFNDLETVGGVRLRRFEGSYDVDGNQVLTDGKLTFDSIYRCKGRKAPAVILLDIDSRDGGGSVMTACCIAV